MLDQLDTPGGHIVVCLALILIGAGFVWFHIPKGDDLIVGASAALFAVMRGLGKNASAEKINGNP